MTPQEESFGRRVLRLLAESGRSQAWLVETAQLSSSVVSRLVRGDRLPTFEHVAAMAPALGVTVDALVAGTDAAQKIAVASPPPPPPLPPVAALRSRCGPSCSKRTRAATGMTDGWDGAKPT